MPIVFAQPEGVSPGYTPGNDSFTKMLIHSDTTNGSTTIIDSSIGGAGSPHGVSMTNGAQHSSSRKKFGTTSMRVAGGNDEISSADHNDWNLGSQNFAIDTWVNFNSVSDGNMIASHFDGGGSNKAWLFAYNGLSDYLQFTYTTDGSTNVVANSGASTFIPTLNQWYHFAVTRSSADLKFFVDGSQVGSTWNISTDSIYNSTTSFRLGCIYVAGTIFTSNTLDGYLDEFRFSVGDSRWTSNFTPPTLPYGP